MHGRAVVTPPLLSAALDGMEWIASRSYRFNPGNHLDGGWMCPKAILEVLEQSKICPWQDSKLTIHLLASHYTDWAITTSRTSYITCKIWGYRGGDYEG
jgi:hypothetical protein